MSTPSSKKLNRYFCPHDAPWEMPCSLCEEEGITYELPNQKSSSERRDRPLRNHPGRTS